MTDAEASPRRDIDLMRRALTSTSVEERAITRLDAIADACIELMKTPGISPNTRTRAADTASRCLITMVDTWRYITEKNLLSADKPAEMPVAAGLSHETMNYG